MLPFLLVEMNLALQDAAELPLDALAHKVAGLPLRLTHFEDDVKANRSSPLAQLLPPATTAAVARARRAFSPAYRGGVTIVTNRSHLGGERVWRCVPSMKNGHSYRATDPYDFRDTEPGPGDANLTGIMFFNCKGMASPHHGPLKSLDPLSPTQFPNQTLVRGNREHFFPRASPGAKRFTRAVESFDRGSTLLRRAGFGASRRSRV